jgi:hypothetical protein
VVFLEAILAHEKARFFFPGNEFGYLHGFLAMPANFHDLIPQSF